MSASETTARNKHSRFPASSIDITKEEFSRISEALKKEEFRKLFLDYCEEIQDPENRKIYEDEIKQLEAERGVECRFINPEPGFVVKTSADGLLKCFINIAKSVEIAKPTNEVRFNEENGSRGLSWSIPMAQAPPRDDLDANNKICRVYDVVFHPDALHLAQRNKQFRKCLIDTALDAVEREYKVKLDRANLKFPKLQYKGIARPTVIRKLAKNPPPEANEPHPLDSIYPERPTEKSGVPKEILIKTKIPPKPEYATPNYVIKHRRGIDLTEYTEELDAKLNVTKPRELVVEIELPLLSSAAECQLDVTGNSVYLLSERVGAKYRLKLDLPYAVNDKDGAARFDTDTRRLSITLPVVQPSLEQQRNMHNTVLHLHREDSGVESDVREGSSTDHSPSESPVQEIEENFAENENEVVEDDETSAACTTKSSDEPFLKNNLPYKLPEKFDCNVLDNVISLVLHVRNVQPESIKKLQLPQSVHINFTSIGSGYYPNYYAFYMKLLDTSDLEIVSIEAEAWENNVILNLHLSNSGESLEKYLVGIDSNDVQTYSIKNKNFKDPKNSTLEMLSGPLESNLDITVERKKLENIVEIDIVPREMHSSTNGANTTEDEESSIITAAYEKTNNSMSKNNNAAAGGAGDANVLQQKKLSRKQRKRNKKQRSLSESSFDDLKSVIQKLEAKEEKTDATNHTTDTIGDFGGSTAQPQRKQRSLSECRDNVDKKTTSFKGILKRYSRYGQPTMRPYPSDSCSSSVEDCSSFSSLSIERPFMSLDFSKSFSDIPEEHDIGNLSESCKKTVRFNDTIQKQIFRLDSSILGQRKKNQKRRDRKQRALQRRLSEGDSADYEEDHKAITIQKGSQQPQREDSKNTDEHIRDRNSFGHKEEKFNGGVKSGKGKKKRNNNSNRRSSRESESSDGDSSNKSSMMFEIDME